MPQKKKKPRPELNRFHEIELEKIYEAMVSSQNIRLQLASFFGTANLAVMSFAFTSQKAGLFFFAALLIWVAMILDIRTKRSVVTYCFRIIQMGRKYANDDDFYLNIIPSTSAKYVRKLLTYESQEKQIKGLQKIPLKYQSISSFWLPLIASIIEISIGIVFLYYGGWAIY